MLKFSDINGMVVTINHLKKWKSVISRNEKNIYGKRTITSTVVILIAILTITTFDCSAQLRAKGSFAFLSGQDRLNVVFNYDELTIMGLPEKDYFEMKSPNYYEEWEKAKSTLFRERFLAYLNKNLNEKRMRMICGNYPNAPYQATIYVIATSRNWEQLICEVDFTPNRSNELLARAYIKSRSKGAFGVRAGTYTYKTGSALGYTGQFLGKFLVQRVKWRKK